MDFKQIEAFVNVVKHKNFSKAADAAFLTQPTISTHIGSLEKELGVQLIDRKGKEALPTPQGNIFYKYAVGILNTREKAIFSIQRFNSEIKGVLEIQTSSVPGEYMIPRLMALFAKDYPEVRYYVEQSDSKLVAENLIQQRGEIGFTGASDDNGLQYEPLIRDEIVLIAPRSPNFLKRWGRSLSITDLIREPFLWREQGSGTRKALESCMADRGISPRQINTIARLNSLEAIKQAVGGGMGVSLISRIAAESGERERPFLIFPLRDFKIDRSFYLVHNKRVTLSPVAELFRTYVLDAYSECDKGVSRA